MASSRPGPNTDTLFRYLVESARDHAIFGIDLDGRIISWGTGAENIKGWLAGEVLGRPVCVLFPEEQRRQGRPEQELKEALEHEHYHGEEPRLRKDGSTFLADVDLWLVRDDAGRPHCFVEVTQDITERKAAEAALREREAQLSVTLDALEEGVTLHDEQARIRFANAAAQRHLGLTAAHLAGLTPFDPRWMAIREDGRPYPGEEHPLIRALREGQSVTGDVMGIRHPDGRLVWLSVNARPLQGPDGVLTGAVTSFFDITARKQAEVERAGLLAREQAALAEAESERRKLFTIFEQAPIGIAIYRGPRHVIEYANPFQCRLWGRTPEDVLGRPVVEALPETEGQGIIETACDSVFRTGEPRVFTELPVRFDLRGTGELEERDFNLTHVPIREPDGIVEGFMGVAWDVTDAVRARERTAELTQELQERVDFEQQLIGIVSHDLRNPLNAIQLTVAAMSRKDGHDARTAQSILRIQSAVQRAVHLVGDLLDFTRSRQCDGIPIDPRPSDLHRVTRRVLDEVEAAYPGRVLRVEARGDATGEWDAERLAQVVQNLVTNALKYSPEDSPVEVATRGEDGWVSLRVHNQGVPIPLEKLPSLFEPFERATADLGRSVRSVGLGLYIVKQLVEAHGGIITVRSSAGEGTTFTVRLPRRGPTPGTARTRCAS